MMADMPEVEVIGRLIQLAHRYGLEELQAEEGGLSVTLRAQRLSSGEPGENGELRYSLWAPPLALGSPGTGSPTRPATAEPLLAPLTGIYYRSPSPDEPPFVEVGQMIEEGQQVGIIEAMKVFSPVTSDRTGLLVELAAANGRQVTHGEPLLYIDPAAAT